MKKKAWYQSKTIWTGIVAIVAAIGAYFYGELEITGLVTAIFGAASVIFLRDGAGVPIEVPKAPKKKE